MKITIRPYQTDDVEPLYEAVRSSVAHLSAWLPWCSEAYSLEDARSWVQGAARAWQEGSDYRFVIVDAVTGRLLGGVGLNQITEQHKVGCLGYWVRSDMLGKGIAKQAAGLALNYGFTQLGLARIEVHVLLDNVASNKVASALGGQLEAVQRNRLFHFGQPRDANCYAIIPKDVK